jgi:hypothetical protein
MWQQLARLETRPSDPPRAVHVIQCQLSNRRVWAKKIQFRTPPTGPGMRRPSPVELGGKGGGGLCLVECRTMMTLG